MMLLLVGSYVRSREAVNVTDAADTHRSPARDVASLRIFSFPGWTIASGVRRAGRLQVADFDLAERSVVQEMEARWKE
jgi:hypothetical protein